MTEKRFVLERSDYDLKYEFRVADISKVKKTKEDFWNEEEEIYEYRKYINYLWENDAFLTLEEADELLNNLYEENKQLKSENLILKGKLHQLRLKCGKQEEELECLSEETIEQFKQDLKDGKFIEYTAR